MLPKEKTSGEHNNLEMLPAGAIAENETGITAGEMERLVQPAAEIVAAHDWDHLPKVLAASLAVRLFVGDHLPQIADLTNAILERAKQRKP